MARSRNIKPALFLNDELAEVEPLGRLLFIGLWTIADRDGRLRDKPAKIKIQVLPYDDCNVNDLLDQLELKGFILRYATDSCPCIQIINFTKHQNPHIKEQASELSAPDMYGASSVQVGDKHGTSPADSLVPLTDSLSTSVIFSPTSQPLKLALHLRNLIQSNSPKQPLPPINDISNRKLQAWARDVDLLHRKGAVGGDSGYSWGEIREVIDWCQESEFWRGNIMSPGKLREKIVTLTNQMSRKVEKKLAEQEYKMYGSEELERINL